MYWTAACAFTWPLNTPVATAEGWLWSCSFRDFHLHCFLFLLFSPSISYLFFTVCHCLQLCPHYVFQLWSSGVSFTLIPYAGMLGPMWLPLFGSYSTNQMNTKTVFTFLTKKLNGSPVFAWKKPKHILTTCLLKSNRIPCVRQRPFIEKMCTVSEKELVLFLTKYSFVKAPAA